MKKYSDKEILEAKELRRQNQYSFAELHRLTGIPATTIRNWCKDEVVGSRWDTLLKANQRKREEIKNSEIEALSSKLDDSNQAKIYLALLYWCEGSKYPASNKVEFTNSDPALMKVFISLLRKSYQIDEAKLRVHLQLHTIHDISEINRYWSEYLSIPETQFIKPIITTLKGGKHRREYRGTCTIRYLDYRVQLKLTGIYEGIAKNIQGISA